MNDPTSCRKICSEYYHKPYEIFRLKVLRDNGKYLEYWLSDKNNTTMKKWLKRVTVALLSAGLLLLLIFILFYNRFVVEAPPSEYAKPSDIREAQLQDLDYLSLYVDKDRSFDNSEKRAAFFNCIDTLKAEIPMDDHKFLLGIAKVMAQANNTHTNISPSFLGRRSNAIPLRFHWFENSLYVVLVQSPYENLLGVKIRYINGKKPVELLALLGEWYGGSKNRLKFYSPLYFMSPELLDAMGCGNTQETVALTYEDNSGMEKNVLIAASEKGKDDAGYWPPNWLNTNLMQSKSEWVTFSHNGPPAVPFQNTKVNVSHTLLDKGVYIQLNRNANSNTVKVNDYLENVMAKIKNEPLNYAILDLRFNPGGDYHLGRSFITLLNKKLNGNPFYIITGNGTFSAGIMTAAIAKDVAKDNAIIIGEPVGDRLQFWADGGSTMKLPNSKIPLRIWTAYHDWENGCKDWSKCFWITIFDGVAVAGLKPEKQIALKFSDYMNGEDSALNTILRLENK